MKKHAAILLNQGEADARKLFPGKLETIHPNILVILNSDLSRPIWHAPSLYCKIVHKEAGASIDPMGLMLADHERRDTFYSFLTYLNERSDLLEIQPEEKNARIVYGFIRQTGQVMYVEHDREGVHLLARRPEHLARERAIVVYFG